MSQGAQDDSQKSPCSLSLLCSTAALKSLGKGSTRSKMSVKSAKMYSTLQKGAVIWDPKPQQVTKVFEALKKGLK
ncbi:RIPOR family member 3 [Varanus komodoensis]|nr:RIPOR family member 3 [Varanus komodoensis]